MNKSAITIICFLLFSISIVAKGRHRAHAKRNLITAKGCISEGTECLVLSAAAGGRKLYSIGRTEKLQVGHAYRITGRESDVGICMEGLPILSPQRITEVKLHCP
jgi:hypothetical protein